MVHKNAKLFTAKYKYNKFNREMLFLDLEIVNVSQIKNNGRTLTKSQNFHYFINYKLINLNVKISNCYFLV